MDSPWRSSTPDGNCFSLNLRSQLQQKRDCSLTCQENKRLCNGFVVALHDCVESNDEQLTVEIIHAARAVHDALGPGYVEAVYNKAFGLELRCPGLILQREKLIRVIYGSQVVGRHYLDLVVENRAVVELKAARVIIPVYEAQMRSYLAATDYKFGLIVNFGNLDVEWKQIARS
jgi:GxxExxY protein